MLGFYASKLSSVELNNTFYRMPKRAVLEGWRERTPEQFRLSVKASRRITHFKKLRECDELLTYLTQGLSVLGKRLGCVLFQLPPTFTLEPELLTSFISRLPAQIAVEGEVPRPFRAAFEFRHASWEPAVVTELLAPSGAALVAGDTDEGALLPLVRTGPFAYLRLRAPEYSEAQLDAWAERLLNLELEEAYVYFKHEDRGPELAQRLSEKLSRRGAEIFLPPAPSPE
jgi:uncharacterized protein YecE (DUF72 family)